MTEEVKDGKARDRCMGETNEVAEEHSGRWSEVSVTKSNCKPPWHVGSSQKCEVEKEVEMGWIHHKDPTQEDNDVLPNPSEQVHPADLVTNHLDV